MSLFMYKIFPKILEIICNWITKDITD